jgi:alpha-tubulin suppressor-like RCC1 family protein
VRGTASLQGVSIVVPPGAFPQGATISIVPASNPDPSTPGGSVGPAFAIESTAEPTTPVELHVPYDPSASGAADEATLGWWSEDTNSWQPVPTSFNGADSQLEARIAHFTFWSWIQKKVLGFNHNKPPCDGFPPSWASVVQTAAGEFYGIIGSCAGIASDGELQVRAQSDHNGFSYVIFQEKPDRLFLYGGPLASVQVLGGWYGIVPPGAVLEANFARPTAPPSQRALYGYAGRDGLTYAGDALLSGLAFLPAGDNVGVLIGKALLGCYSLIVRAADSQLPVDEGSALDCAWTLIKSGLSAAEQASAETVVKNLLGKVGFWVNVAKGLRDFGEAILTHGALPTVVDATLTASQPLVQPTITGFAPVSGPVGTSVTITGAAFTGATAVTFNGAESSHTVDSDTQITATVPAGATTGAIAVTTPGGTGASAIAFTVTGLLPGGAKISAGRGHTCAVTSGSGVKCWGNNFSGQLGNGTLTDSSTPVDVIGLQNGVVAVSAGEAHTCALTVQRAVKCWGNNNDGKLGNGTTTHSSTPVDVSGLQSGVVAISVGGVHTCALTSTGGVKRWGKNNAGQLGDGTKFSRSTPVYVSGLESGVVAISAGYIHTCALTVDGAAYCWGSDLDGQLGDDRPSVLSTLPVGVIGLESGVGRISGGGEHTCAVTSAGAAKCWGSNFDGELGDGTTTERFTPVDVSGLQSGVGGISAGYSHTCAVTSAGAAKCWGSNFDGELGNGTTTSSSIPVNVSGLQSGVAELSAGDEHTCARLSTGATKCWGSNFDGELGNGTTTSSSTPMDVVGF